MQIYIASSFDLLDRVKELEQKLEEEMVSSITYKWWVHEEDKRVSSGDPRLVYTETEREVESKAIGGINLADCFVIVAPQDSTKKFNGANIELGYALAHGIPCFCYGALERSAMYSRVRQHDDIDKLLEDIDTSVCDGASYYNKKKSILLSQSDINGLCGLIEYDRGLNLFAKRYGYHPVSGYEYAQFHEQIIRQREEQLNLFGYTPQDAFFGIIGTHMNTYQREALKTAVYMEDMDIPEDLKNVVGLFYTALGLGEAGEFQNKVKKVIRDDKLKLSIERREQLVKELGDVLWYVAMAAHELGFQLEDVARSNIDKLSKRDEGCTLCGCGDDR